MLTANYEYSRSNKENLTLPIQTKLSKNQSTFCVMVLKFLESTSTKLSLIGQIFLKLLTPKYLLI